MIFSNIKNDRKTEIIYYGKFKTKLNENLFWDVTFFVIESLNEADFFMFSVFFSAHLNMKKNK